VGRGLGASPATFAYTNHTVLPEALESWSIDLFGRLLPRHLEIIEEIDRRFRIEVEERSRTTGAGRADGDPLRRGRCGWRSLAIVGSHTVNGVAELHTQILRERIFRDFYELWPGGSPRSPTG
jgi:glycogen phosphorylase